MVVALWVLIVSGDLLLQYHQLISNLFQLLLLQQLIAKWKLNLSHHGIHTVHNFPLMNALVIQIANGAVLHRFQIAILKLQDLWLNRIGFVEISCLSKQVLANMEKLLMNVKVCVLQKNVLRSIIAVAMVTVWENRKGVNQQQLNWLAWTLIVQKVISTKYVIDATQ